jgi:hypothetical protein
MKKFIAILLILLLLICVSAGCNVDNTTKESAVVSTQAQESENVQKADNIIPFKTYTLLQLQDDFKQFQSTIESQHPMLYTNKEELSQLFKTQYEMLKDNMEELEFYRVLSPIAAKLNCGHTSLSFSKEYEEFVRKQGRYLPFTVKIIENRAYTFQCPLTDNIPAGSEILSINGKTTGDIINTCLNNLTADGSNTSKKYYILNHWFNDQYYNYIDSPEKFVISYINPADGKTLKEEVSAVNKEELDSAVSKLSPVSAHQGEMYYGELEKNHAVLTIKSFGFYDEEGKSKFKAFIDEYFNSLEKSKVSNLILDVRDNWGGDPYCTSHLFSYLESGASPYFSEEAGSYYADLKEPVIPAENSFKGKLYILTNGASFSSTGHLCSLLKFHKIGTFIGDETGGSFVCTDSSQDISLVNTNLRLHYSTAPWKVAVSGLTPGRGIIPDHLIIPTIADYINNRDVEMEFALGLIK